MTYTLIANSSSVRRDADGAAIPDAAGNIDWQAYQAWLTAGNTPTPAAAPTSAQVAAAAYAAAIAAGLAITSTSTPALTATYGVDSGAQTNIDSVPRFLVFL